MLFLRTLLQKKSSHIGLNTRHLYLSLGFRVVSGHGDFKEDDGPTLCWGGKEKRNMGFNWKKIDICKRAMLVVRPLTLQATWIIAT